MGQFKLRDYQLQASDAAIQFFNDDTLRTAIIVLPTGCHSKGYPILMYDGSLKPVEEIKVGDLIMGDDNTSRKVLSLHRGNDMMYKITPIKGEPFIVNGGHIMHLYKTKEGEKFKCYGIRYDEISVNDYISKSHSYKHVHKLHKSSVVDFQEREDLPIDPYFIGLLLGDGSTIGSIGITTMEEEVKEYLYKFARSNGYTIRDYVKPNNKAHTYYLKGYGGRPHQWFSKTSLRLELEVLGLFGKTAENKSIPHCYKTSSIENRLQLLAGLVDTDGYLHNNCIEYISKSETLIKDLIFLCRSLGLSCNLNANKVVNGEVYYRSMIYGNIDIIPSKVHRRIGTERKQKKNNLVTGFSVTPVGNGDYYGFTVDGNHLYLDGQFFVHHNSGKSCVISDIANRLDDNVLVFQPSKEILQQNLSKMRNYTDDCSAYSASVGEKKVSKITFATIGSVKEHIDEFKHFHYVMIDECQGVSGEHGMYLNFLRMLNCKVLGFTATPFRLYSETDYDYVERKHTTVDARLVMLTNDDNRFFEKIIYKVQVADLLARGYLAQLKYFDVRPKGWNEDRMYRNSSGNEYSENSVEWMMRQTNHFDHVVSICRRLLNPKSGVPRKGILVFMQFVEDAKELCTKVADAAYVCGETTKKNRERILEEFKNGTIKVLVNVGTLIRGYDYPALDTVVLARPTLSLEIFYQSIGRAIRPSLGKEAWIVDTVGNTRRFGQVANLRIETSKSTKTDEMFGWVYDYNTRQYGWKQLTGVSLKS